MASAPVKSTDAKPLSKYDDFIQQKLSRAGNRVRHVDLLASVLVLLIGFAAYALLLPWLDYSLQLPLAVRMIALCGLFAGIAGFFVWQFRAVLQRDVNPYYSARQLEKTVPDAKESVINWLDLRDETLPAAFRGALSVRAAKDLKQAELDRVAATRKNWLLTVVLLAFVIPLLFLLITRPGQTTSLWGRAFLPFSDYQVPTRTSLILVEPDGGNGFVGENQPVQFRVRINGRIPARDAADAPKLFFRYRQADPYSQQALYNLRDDEWTAKLLASQIVGGRVYYKLAAGDAETPEYLVQVRGAPRVIAWNVTYLPREYRQWRKRSVPFPNENAVFPEIEDYQGTDVVLSIRTNRKLQSANLELRYKNEQQTIAGEAVADDARSMQFKFPLTESGKFKIQFLSVESEANSDLSEYAITVLKDQMPKVKLIKPGKDVKLPANGLLQLEGWAEDDFGVKAMILRMQLVEEKKNLDLLSKPYREGKSFKLPDGSYPDGMKYKDFVALDKLKQADQAPIRVYPGMTLLYWLEAVDSCNFPNPDGHRARSKTYKVLIADPEKDQDKIDEQQQQAEQDQANHEQKQDDNFNDLAKDIKEKQNGDGKSTNPEDRDFKNKLKELTDAAKKNDNNKNDGSDKAEPSPSKGASKGKGDDKKGNNPDPANAKQGKSADKENKSETKKGDKKGDDKAKGKGMGEKQPAPSDDSQKGAAKKGDEKQPSPSQAKGANDKKSPNKNAAASANKEQPPNNQSQAKGGEKKDSQKAPASAKKDEHKKETQSKGGACCNKGGGKKSGECACAKGDGTSGNGGQQAGNTKAGPSGNKKDQVANAKQPNNGGGQAADASQQKSGGQPGAKPGPAQAKGEPKSGSGTSTASNNAKEKKNGAGADGNKNRNQDPRLKKIAKLEKDYQNADQQTKKKILDQLKKMEQDAKDSDLRKAAEEAMKRAEAGEPPPSDMEPGKKPGAPGAQPGTKDKGGKSKQGGTAKTDGKNGEPSPPGKSPGDGTKTKTVKNNPKTGKKDRNPDGTGKPKVGPDIERPGKADKANEKFAGRGGNLQLEELQEMLKDPNVRKQLQNRYGWTEDDMRRFLQAARNYQQRQTQQADAALPAPGSFESKLGGDGVRRIGTRPSRNTFNDETGRAAPPPEYRSAYERLTSGQELPNQDGTKK